MVVNADVGGTTPEPTSSADQPARAFPIEAEEALSAWITNQTAGVWTSPAGWWYAAWMHREPEVASLRADLEHTRQIVGDLEYRLGAQVRDAIALQREAFRLKAQLAVQAEVIEAARESASGMSGGLEWLRAALARLDAADVPATREGEQ